MTNKRIRKKRTATLSKQLPSSKSQFVNKTKERKQPTRNRRQTPKWVIGCLGFGGLSILSLIIYQVFLSQYILERTCLLPQIVTNYLIGIVFLVIGFSLFMGLLIKEERKKVTTYFLATLGLIPLMVSFIAFSEGTRGMLDIGDYHKGNYRVEQGVMEDYSITSTRYGPDYIGTVTIKGTEYDISGYISIPEAKAGVGKLNLKVYYLPHSKWGIIVKFYDEYGDITKVVDKRLPKDLK